MQPPRRADATQMCVPDADVTHQPGQSGSGALTAVLTVSRLLEAPVERQQAGLWAVLGAHSLCRVPPSVVLFTILVLTGPAQMYGPLMMHVQVHISCWGSLCCVQIPCDRGDSVTTFCCCCHKPLHRQVQELVYGVLPARVAAKPSQVVIDFFPWCNFGFRQHDG